MAVGTSKVDNLARAVGMVKQAAAKGANLVVLPVSLSLTIPSPITVCERKRECMCRVVCVYLVSCSCTFAEFAANIAFLQECFNSPYGTSYFPEYAETIPGPSTQTLSQAAKDNNVFLIGGKTYNVLLSFKKHVTELAFIPRVVVNGY